MISSGKMFRLNVMTPFYKRLIFFLLIVTSLGEWLPLGGYRVRTPALETYLHTLARENHDLYLQTIPFAIPSALCGLKIHMEEPRQSSFFKQLNPIVDLGVLTLDSFIQIPLFSCLQVVRAQFSIKTHSLFNSLHLRPPRSY